MRVGFVRPFAGDVKSSQAAIYKVFTVVCVRAVAVAKRTIVLQHRIVEERCALRVIHHGVTARDPVLVVLVVGNQNWYASANSAVPTHSP